MLSSSPWQGFNFFEVSLQKKGVSGLVFINCQHQSLKGHHSVHNVWPPRTNNNTPERGIIWASEVGGSGGVIILGVHILQTQEDSRKNACRQFVFARRLRERPRARPPPSLGFCPGRAGGRTRTRTSPGRRQRRRGRRGRGAPAVGRPPGRRTRRGWRASGVPPTRGGRRGLGGRRGALDRKFVCKIVKIVVIFRKATFMGKTAKGKQVMEVGSNGRPGQGKI